MFLETARITPEEFEQLTEVFLQRLGGQLAEFSTTRREKLAGTDGRYEIDVTARFEALGAEFLVLVECKYHKAAIKREVVQVLRDRLQATGASKGMLFATANFQSGAVEYAVKHRIALIRVAGRNAEFVTRSTGSRPADSIALAIPRLALDGSVSYQPVDLSRRHEPFDLTTWPPPSIP